MVLCKHAPPCSSTPVPAPALAQAACSQGSTGPTSGMLVALLCMILLARLRSPHSCSGTGVPPRAKSLQRKQGTGVVGQHASANQVGQDKNAGPPVATCDDATSPVHPAVSPEGLWGGERGVLLLQQRCSSLQLLLQSVRMGGAGTRCIKNMRRAAHVLSACGQLSKCWEHRAAGCQLPKRAHLPTSGSYARDGMHAVACCGWRS